MGGEERTDKIIQRVEPSRREQKDMECDHVVGWRSDGRRGPTSCRSQPCGSHAAMNRVGLWPHDPNPKAGHLGLIILDRQFGCGSCSSSCCPGWVRLGH